MYIKMHILCGQEVLSVRYVLLHAGFYVNYTKDFYLPRNLRIILTQPVTLHVLSFTLLFLILKLTPISCSLLCFWFLRASGVYSIMDLLQKSLELYHYIDSTSNLTLLFLILELSPISCSPRRGNYPRETFKEFRSAKRILFFIDETSKPEFQLFQPILHYVR